MADDPIPDPVAHEARIVGLIEFYAGAFSEDPPPARAVWTDRGECWPTVSEAAKAVGIKRGTIYKALDIPTRRGMGRKWLSVPP